MIDQENDEKRGQKQLGDYNDPDPQTWDRPSSAFKTRGPAGVPLEPRFATSFAGMSRHIA